MSTRLRRRAASASLLSRSYREGKGPYEVRRTRRGVRSPSDECPAARVMKSSIHSKLVWVNSDFMSLLRWSTSASTHRPVERSDLSLGERDDAEFLELS